MDFFVRSLALTAATGTGTPTAPQTSSVKYSNSTSATTQSTPITSSSVAITRTPLHFNNVTQVAGGFNSSAAFNTTRTPDLNNATDCMQEYWTESWKSQSWMLSYRTTVVTTATYLSRAVSAVPQQPLGNVSYTRLCDGLPRFTNTADEAKVIARLNTTTTYTFLRTQSVIMPAGTDENPYTPISKCSIKSGEECSNIWALFASTRASILSNWASTNILTISVAPTPTAVTINGQAAPLTAVPGQLPALPIHGNMYTAGLDSTWSIDDAYNMAGETFITPGQRVTFTWNLPDKPTPWGPNECARPTESNFNPSRCSRTAPCTIKANSVELLFFPPPSTTRDLCANTSPGFNKYSQSIYAQPHESVVINGTTFWQDKAYVRYDTVSAYRRCEADNGLQTVTAPVGNTYTNTFVEVESKDISTICGWQQNQVRPFGVIVGATAVPMNFDDMNGPVPESAYQCIYGCGIRGGCSSIVQSLFNPNLAVPPQVRDLDPEWAQCVPYFEGTHDPPIALSTVSNMFSTASPTLAPTPGDLPSPNMPVQTNRPGPPSDPKPSDPAADPSGPGSPGQPASNNDPPRPQTSGNRPPPLTTSFTDFIPLPTPQTPPNNPVNPPQNGNPTTPNNPPSNNDQPAQPNGPPPNVPINLPNSPPSSPITTIGNQPVIADPSRPGIVIIGTPGSPTATTLTPGGAPVVISGTTLSIAPSGTALSVSGIRTLRPITTINGQPVFIDPARPDQVTVGDPGNPSAQQTFGVNSDGVVIISGTTLSVAAAATAGAQSNRPPSTVVINGLPVTVLPDGSISITSTAGTQILRPGAPQISIDGHTVFLSPAGEVVIDGKPYKLESRREPKDVVIIGPDGSRTTVPISQATATPDAILNKNQAVSKSLSVDSVRAASRSSGSSGATIASLSGGSVGGNRPSVSTSTSKGDGIRNAVGNYETVYICIGAVVGALGVLL